MERGFFGHNVIRHAQLPQRAISPLNKLGAGSAGDPPCSNLTRPRFADKESRFSVC